MAKPSHRDRILDAGLRVMFRSGYTGSSVRDVTTAAAVPQGSFTNHFRSKEAFAGEVLDRYFEHVRGLVQQALDDTTLTPRSRLRRYLDLITERLAEDNFERGCLIGDFSLEASPQSAALREQLRVIFAEWRQPFARCIAEAQAAGEIASTFPPTELAEFLLASWEGAILRMKVDGTSAALERFQTIAFQTVFADTMSPSPRIVP
jgi:TetR/AcrR family transcriptional repressor of nem operon